MDKRPIQEFLQEFRIEEKIPYFGKARLYTLPMSFFEKSFFHFPKEVFHFMTAIYILDPNKDNKYVFRINTYEKNVDSSHFSDISQQNNTRTNILEDPIFLGMNTLVSLGKLKTEGIDEKASMNILVEYAKISPDLYHQLHQNEVVLVSKQYETEILQCRGNAP
jgi:hypothetical protein